MSEQLKGDMEAYVHDMDVISTEAKNSSSALKKKELEVTQMRILNAMNHFNIEFSQVGNKYISIDIVDKPLKSGKDLAIEITTTFLYSLVEVQSREQQITKQQVADNISRAIGMPISSLPESLHNFKDVFKAQTGEKIQKLVISDTKPVHQIVAALKNL